MEASLSSINLGEIKGSSSLICKYCGIETIALGGIGICSNCEAPLSFGREALSKSDNELVQKLENINELVKKSEFQNAISIYDQIISSTKELGFVYAEALLYVKLSNFEASQIRYDRTGFMEENTTHRDLSAKNAAISKRLLTKLIYQSRNEESPTSSYFVFLSFIKLYDIMGARKALEDLKNSGATDYLKEYAEMMFYASSKEYQKTLDIAKRFTTNARFSINSFFYIAYSLFRSGKKKDAAKIALQAKRYISSGNVDALLLDIEESDAIAR